MTFFLEGFYSAKIFEDLVDKNCSFWFGVNLFIMTIY